MLPQDIARWPVTARENATLGQGDGDDQAVMTAAELAGAGEVIAQLADGLDTNPAPSQWVAGTCPAGSGSA
ncbi:hypothetical protein ACWGI1_37210, partial [Streptomyces sp. NPDC054835]